VPIARLSAFFAGNPTARSQHRPNAASGWKPTSIADELFIAVLPLWNDGNGG